MNTLRKIFKSIPIFTFLLIFGFFSCSEKKTDTIKIGILRGPTEISFMQLIDNNLNYRGKKVEIIIKNDPQQIQALMIQKKIDFAVLPTVMSANLHNKGVNYKMLACPIWGTMYILSNNPQVKSINDLKNRSISVFGQGITPDILLKNLLINRGLTNVKIDYTFTSNTDLAQAMLQKRVENAVLSEPLVSILLNKDTTLKNISQLSCESFIDNLDTDIFIQTAFTVNSSFANKYPDIVQFICKEYSKSCNFIEEQPLEAAQLAVKLKIIPDLKTALISLPLCNIRYVGAFSIEHELKHYLNIFLNFDPECVGGKLPSKDFIYRKILIE